MATIKKTQVETKLTVLLELNESEVKALSAIFGYNVNAFLKVFYERMGSAYVAPYESGVRSLHKTLQGALSESVEVVDKARKAMQDSLSR
tara:strand:+ start:2248 stop:2517 length:270 start_codon:yes stop_codon:yes gene_type:complete